ncbi:MAG TPA: DHCW motif cupin fold protein [Thermoplasmata archaeon]|nr:DHCW motif cupin fold protein [Thermoplasmata archaeon]
MELQGLPFVTIDWDKVPVETHPGAEGTASSRVFESGPVRARMVEYSAGYRADHWCRKGHIVLCVRGEFVSEHQDGSRHRVREGVVYIVGDDTAPHRSSTETGTTLFIVD